MSKSVTFLLDEGLLDVVKAAAKRKKVSQSDWLREAVNEHIKGNMERNLIGQMDARVFKLMQAVEAQKEDQKANMESIKANIQQIRGGMEQMYAKLLDVEGKK